MVDNELNRPTVTNSLTNGIQTRELKASWREALWAYGLISPALIFLIAFTVIPVIMALGISFTDWNLVNAPNFIQTQNYEQILTDPIALKTLLNTFSFTFMSVPIGLVLSLGLAMLLNQKIRGLSFFRTAYYLPVISSTVAVAMVALWIFDSNYGLMNRFLALFGVPGINWLTDPDFAMFAIVIVSVWRSLGFNMIIFLATLQDVPHVLQEAASIDGATPSQKFIYVTVPLITPAIFFSTVTGLITSFQSFDLVYNMTKGGPARATYLVGYYIYDQAFKYLHMGYGAAIAFVLFAIILIFTLVQWYLRRQWVFGEE